MRKDTSLLLATLGLCLMLVVGYTFFQSLPSRLHWIQDYEQALQVARTQKKYVLSYLYTDWCGYCKKMEAETFKNKDLIDEMSESYVWLKLNAENDEDGRQLQQRFNITGYPALIILDADGEEIERIAGFVPAEGFRKRVKAAVSALDSFDRIAQRARTQPDSPEDQYLLAEKYIERKKFEKAIDCLRRVINLDPKNNFGKTDLSYYYLALSLATQGAEQDAIVELNSLEDTFPQSRYVPDSVFLRGQIQHHTGNRSEAEKIFIAYVKNYPDHAHVSKARDILDEGSSN